MKRKTNKEFTRVGNIIGDIMRNYRRPQDADMLRIWEIWEQTVGMDIARNARPSAFKGDLLVVNVASSPWLQQIRYMKAEIIANVNAALDVALIRDIRFKIGPL